MATRIITVLNVVAALGVIASYFFIDRHIPPMRVTIEGKTYEYDCRDVAIRDLNSDLINVEMISTSTCDLIFSRSLRMLFPRLIQMSEDGYRAVAADLQYDYYRQRPQIYFLEHDQYHFLSPDTVGAIVSDCFPAGKNKIIIDTDRFPPAEFYTGQVVKHELAHFICYYLRGEVNPRNMEHLSGHFWSFHYFDEAVAQLEEERPSALKDDLRRAFPGGDYFTFGSMDVSTAPQDMLRIIVQYRALLQMLIETKSQLVLSAICRRLGRQSVLEAIKAETKWSSDDLYDKWFTYMNRLKAD